MNKTAVFLTVSLTLELSAAYPGFCSPRKHHPWFSHSSSSHHKALKVASVPAKIEVKETDDSTPLQKSSLKGDAAGHKVAEQALHYKGTRYKFGGTNKRGLDCSGLVARVWSDLKMKRVPRVSSALYHSGQPVSLAELRPGDLVFFKNTYKSGISHVGVYTGSNKFVHAANHRKGVTITRLSDPYYQLHYAGARRLY